LLKARLGIDEVDNPDYRDTIALCVCGGVYGLTLIMLVYAWCNYNYRPIRAKNLTWTTLIYLSAVLWFIGNVATNNHVPLVGVWSKCKVWIIWFRVCFTFVFVSMTIVRFYALDSVFNQKKPFTAWSGAIAFATVFLLNATYCLASHLISDSLTVQYVSSVEVCFISTAFRIASITFQWIEWLLCGYLVFRLRNIQSTFNEFYESIAIFLVIIALLIETTVLNFHFQHYTLHLAQRIEKTFVDALATNIVVWLIIGYPVVMSIFRRHGFEQEWVDKLPKDGPCNADAFKAKKKCSSLYSKMNDASNEQYFSMDGRMFESADLARSTQADSPNPLFNSPSFFAEGAFGDGPRFARNNNLHLPLQRDGYVHSGPVLSSPASLAAALGEPSPSGRFVI
ncbi:hypothetical protein H4R19_004252, partial [Coemansia spiralis]